MINYHVRQAGSTLSVLDYCSKQRFALPSEYDSLRFLLPTDLISGNTLINLFGEIEKHSDDPLFFTSVEQHLITSNVLAESRAKPIDTPPATLLAGIIRDYASRLSTSRFQLHETDSSVVFVNRRYKTGDRLKYADLMIYAWYTNVIKPVAAAFNSRVSISLPYEKGFYGRYRDYFETVQFGNGEFKIEISKESHEVLPELSVFNQISPLEKTIAAGNMLSRDSINLTSLAFLLGCSNKLLSYEIKNSGLSASQLINSIKFERVRKQLDANGWNIKEVAYDFGFKNHSGITKIFLNSTGVTPSEFRRLQAQNPR
ncbi:helix-turn-helix domain-containing protein [Ferrimonas balearica]|uniref:helix-turn-helix domain-containing protein n=1 Tax=Ferrimonas balearica TaxID=44012 RepID=UPI001C588303|nr:helix-turn-helix domain-containing protein [Ferrimonas balearica]MBW3138877.1 helix-turn-helix domain-containing protein [Ferrimonas balearica]MBY6105941.1 helix-turn-helix domain-containing protein [Ferrimonas balearica]